MTTVGTIAARVVADTAQFDIKLQESAKKANKFGKDVGGGGLLSKGLDILKDKFIAVGSAVAATAAGFFAFNTVIGNIVDQFKAVDEAADISDKLGTSVNELESFRIAASRAGMEAGNMDASVQKMIKNIQEAASSGKGATFDALEMLGLDADALDAAGPLQAMTQIADKMANLQSQSDRLSLTLDIFGKSGGGLAAVFKDGSTALEQAAADAERFNLTISEADASQLGAVDDAVNNVKMAFQGFWRQISVALGPAVEDIANAIADFFANLGDHAQTARPLIQEMAQTFADGFEAAIGVAKVLTDIFAGFLGIMEDNYDHMVMMGRAIGAILSPATALLALFNREFGEENTVGSGGSALGFDPDAEMERIAELKRAADEKEKLEKEQLKLEKEMMKEWEEAYKHHEEEKKRWLEKGNALAASLRTPMEEYAAKIEEITTLIRGGAISWDTFDRAALDAMKSLEDAKEKERKAKKEVRAEAGGALVRGTVAEFSARHESNESLKKIRDASVHTAEFTKRSLDELKRIHTKLGDSTPIVAVSF